MSRAGQILRSSLPLVLVAIGLALATPARGDDSSATRYYVSLGDSFAVGTQPIGEPPDYETDEGYADQLYATLRVADPKLKLVKLGCGGESTTSMRFGSQLPTVARSCGRPEFYLHRYPHKTQLAEAVAFLEAHKGKVDLITIDIGGNDVLGPGGIGEITANLPYILDALRGAIDDDVPIVALNYYNAFLPSAWADGGLDALRSAVAALDAFNGTLEAIYAPARVPVADVAAAFHSADFTLVDGTPLDVLVVCQWTWSCAAGDLHPKREGYGVMAQTIGVALNLPYVDDTFWLPTVGLPQYACPPGYLLLGLFDKPPTDPLWQHDLNGDRVICRRWPS